MFVLPKKRRHRHGKETGKWGREHPKAEDGRWEGRYTAGYDEKTGKRLIKNVLGKTQAEVKEKLAKAVAEAESVDVRRADQYTLGKIGRAHV